MVHDVFDAAPSRRAFLKATAGGAAFLLVGGLLPAGCRGYAPPGGPPLQVLDARTAAIFDAVADAMIDDGSGVLPLPSALGIHRRFDTMLAGIHPAMQEQVKLMLRAFEHLTLPFGLHISRFTKLEPADRRACLESWAASSLSFRRMVFQALKIFVHMNYYTFPETWPVLGYDGPWVGRIDVPYFEPPLARALEEDPL